MANKGAYAAIEIDDDDEVIQCNTRTLTYTLQLTDGEEHKQQARNQPMPSVSSYWNKTPRLHTHVTLWAKPSW